MRRTILLVISPERFRDEEFEEPRRLLEAAGHRVRVASTRTGTAVGVRGSRVTVEDLIAAMNARDLDAVAVVGGAGCPDHLWDHEPLIALVRNMAGAGRPVASICLGSGVLARAGVLAGIRATGFNSPRLLAELKRGGARYLADEVVAEGMILTASGPEASVAFASRLVTLLSR